MNVGMIGLGKLGLPVAAAIAAKGHTVYGTDSNLAVAQYLIDKKTPYQEAMLDDLLELVDLTWCDTPAEVAARSDIVFIAVQTPHDPAYEGVTVAPERRKDFEYGYLVQAYREVAAAANPDTVIAVISTVLPGTVHKHRLNTHRRTVYNPFFIAMGTTAPDFLEPEFVILGSDDDDAAAIVTGFYKTIHDRPVVRTTVESAELVKVAYNGVISAKIVLANWIGEICDKTSADADEVHRALSYANDRLWSPKYFKAGMGDGGGCHPRDNIALSWLAEHLDLSVDVGGFVTAAREAHTAWLARQCLDWHELTKLPIRILGLEYKPDTALTVGSPARLLLDLLDGAALGIDDPRPDIPAVYLVGCQHARYADAKFVAGSVVLDPFGYIPDQPGVTVRRIGRK